MMNDEPSSSSTSTSLNSNSPTNDPDSSSPSTSSPKSPDNGPLATKSTDHSPVSKEMKTDNLPAKTSGDVTDKKPDRGQKRLQSDPMPVGKHYVVDSTPSSAPQHCDGFYLRRVKSEMADWFKNPVNGIHLVPDENNLTIFHAVIVGPENTPYEGGFFYFFIKVPEQYPIRPPVVKLMTTGNGTIRFNPNLYANGTVCLSILGTWQGPSWTAAITLIGVLLSIQSLMNAKPFYNEPGYEGRESCERLKSLAEDYNDRVRYYTLKVAVLDMVEDLNEDSSKMPICLKSQVKSTLLQNFKRYDQLITENLGSTKYEFAPLQQRLLKIRGSGSTSSKS